MRGRIVKKIKKGEYEKAVCHRCQRPAEWRGNRLPVGKKMYACDEHKHEIRVAEAKQSVIDDGYTNEADEQSWMRL